MGGAAVKQRLQSLERSFGGKHNDATSVHSFDVQQYKLFDYVCPNSNCKDKRQIQYFHSGGCFVSQLPTVVCGGCREYIDPTTIFKTADFQCPQCDVIRRVRIPARPVPLETYKRTLATCDQCWFRGEVATGRHIVAVCEDCHMHASRLADVWSENGDTLSLFCEGCRENTQAVVLPHALMARLLRGGSQLEQGAIHFLCPQCKVPQHASFGDLVASRATCTCNGCGWRGPPPEDKKGTAARSMSGQGAAPTTQGTPIAGNRQQPFFGAVPPMPPNPRVGRI